MIFLLKFLPFWILRVSLGLDMLFADPSIADGLIPKKQVCAVCQQQNFIAKAIKKLYLHHISLTFWPETGIFCRESDKIYMYGTCYAGNHQKKQHIRYREDHPVSQEEGKLFQIGAFGYVRSGADRDL